MKHSHNHYIDLPYNIISKAYSVSAISGHLSIFSSSKCRVLKLVDGFIYNHLPSNTGVFNKTHKEDRNHYLNASPIEALRKKTFDLVQNHLEFGSNEPHQLRALLLNLSAETPLVCHFFKYKRQFYEMAIHPCAKKERTIKFHSAYRDELPSHIKETEFSKGQGNPCRITTRPCKFMANPL